MQQTGSIAGRDGPIEEGPPPFWSHLQAKAGLADYRPRPAAGVVVGEQEGHYVLNNPRAGTYMRLSPEEHTLWTWMDGQASVRDLAVRYFLQHQRLLPVAELVRRLRRGHMLADPPAQLRAQLQAAVEEQETPWGRRLLDLLWGYPLYVRGLHRFFQALYRWGGRLLFTRPLIWLQRLVALAGLVVFVLLLLAGRPGYQIFRAGQSYFLGLGLLLLLNLGTLSLHESAHALATIHQGCRVRRGGLMLYVGLPTLFVDTTDTWMVGKEGRIQVAMAGPWNDLVVGGLCALLALPGWEARSLLFKIATLAYVSALFNLNPLLEMDGYYALCDKLDLPNLRRDALAFVGRGLWSRVRRRQPLSPRERLYTIYGALSLLYLILVVSLALIFWRTQVTRLLAGLAQRGMWGRVAAVALVALVGVPLALLVGRRLSQAGRRAWRALSERGYLARGGLRLVLVAGATLALILLFRLLPISWQRLALPFLPLLLYGGGLVALTAVLPWYRGAAFRRVLVGLSAVMVILSLGSALEIGWGLVGVGREAARLAQLAALLVALAAFSPQDLVRAHPVERTVMGLLLVGGFVLSVALLSQALLGQASPDRSLWALLWTAGPAFSGALALALLVPTVVSFAATPFAPCWLLFALALSSGLARSAWPMGRAAAVGLDLAMALLMAQGAALYLLAQRNLVYRHKRWTGSPAQGAQPRLRRAFGRFYGELFALFRDTFGHRRAQILDDRLDVIAVTANWLVAVDGGRVREIVDLEGRPIEELATQYTDLLERSLDILDELAGRPFLRRALQSAYDRLPWMERETLTRWVLRRTSWGEAVSQDLASRQDEAFRLLAGVPLFLGLDEEALLQVRAALQEERVPAGQVIARQGETAAALYVVARGEVEAWREDDGGRENLVGELHRGDAFGEEALLGETPLQEEGYRATYRASVDTTLLQVAGQGLEELGREAAHPSAQMRARAQLLSRLAGLDLFQGLPWGDLQAMAGLMQRQQVPAWERVLREGEPVEAFCLIEQGKVLVVNDWGQESEEIVAEMGPGESFGQVAFLEQAAPATVLTVAPCAFWALPVAHFRRFLERSLG